MPDDARHAPSSAAGGTRPGPAAGDAAAWRRNVRLILLLLSLWAALTFLPAWFARDLPYTLMGWPLSFWIAAYGAPLAYLVIVVFYARLMNRGDDPWDE